MADREFVFGRPDVQKILREQFVIVAADDWYQRRQNDALGKFFRSVADQGPRKGAGGGTRQGRYAFSASGTLLGFNNNRDPQRILNMLRESLRKYEALPAGERKAGAFKVPTLNPGALDERYARPLTQDTVVMKVHGRVLERDRKGNYAACGEPGANNKSFRHTGFGVSTDHLWLQEAELEQLTALALKNPQGVAVPRAVAMRIARFHLVDNTRGEPPHWNLEEVRKLILRATMQPKAAGARHSTNLRITGAFHLETKDGKRGYTGEISGFLRTISKTRAREFQFVAVGQHWGEGTYTRGARPGKTPFAVAFTLADSQKAKNCVPPQAIRWEKGYYEADRH